MRAVGSLIRRGPDSPAEIDGQRSTLASLTPSFDADQHQTYVDHLNEAVRDPRNRNIALSGRYGSGKSSVLAAFSRQSGFEDRVLFLAFSTLGPGAQDESRTNQIEKELVKQLLHRERPSRLPQSRYHRIRTLPRWRAIAEAAFLLLAVLAIAYLLGADLWVPGLESEDPIAVRVAALVLTIAAILGLVVWTRLALHNRFRLAGVSAAGASITLSDTSDSYFDQYLDEIVYFFETVRGVDIVVFEDLDRFDDPGIFEALRELNTLLNSSKQLHGRNIRFVFALRDSIFERLGHDERLDADDAANPEAVRANRTKFFDIVIPIVPFITHRNARDLLTQLLDDTNLPGSVRPSLRLVDLVSRHLPEMRLLTNVVNEYVVFSTRLITDGRGIAGLEPDQLFAMVVYKNVHLKDFEQIQLGHSSLDELYRQSRSIVAQSVSSRRRRLNRLAEASVLEAELDRQVSSLGDTLAWLVGRLQTQAHPHHAVSNYSAGGESFQPDDINSAKFWRTLLDSDGAVQVTLTRQGQPRAERISLAQNDLDALFGRRLKFGVWETAGRLQVEQERSRLESELALLSHIDFADLASRNEFKTTTSGEDVTFSDLLNRHIDSDIGRSLVRSGYIDSHYALYVAQYYGVRVPRNAMNFLLQHVELNQPDHLYSFADDLEIEAVLREARPSFLSERSAYNVAILDHLMVKRADDAEVVLDSLLSRFGGAEADFLETYFAEGELAQTVAERLAKKWPELFTHLLSPEELDPERRLQLIDSALAGSDPDLDYELDDEVRDFFQTNYTEFPVLHAAISRSGLTQEEAENRSQRAAQVMTRSGFVCDDLSAVSAKAMQAFVKADAYELSAGNLRVATGSANLSLDQLRSSNIDVYHDAIAAMDRYMSVLDQIESNSSDCARDAGGADQDDDRPLHQWTVEDPAVFSEVVQDLAGLDHADLVPALKRAHPECLVQALVTAPTETWTALAECRRFAPTAANATAYFAHAGVDNALAQLLRANDFRFDVADPTDKSNSPADDDVEADSDGTTEVELAGGILAATDVLPRPSDRVQLVASLDLNERLSIDSVPVEPGPLLGLLLKHDLVTDTPETIAHFAPLDWTTLRVALQHSTNLIDSLRPEQLAEGTIASLLKSSDIDDQLKRSVLDRFGELISPQGQGALEAAGRTALEIRSKLDSGQIGLIAAGTGNKPLVLELLARFGAGFTVDQHLDAMAQIGSSPYDKLRTLAMGEKLDFDRDAVHEEVMMRIKTSARFAVRRLPGSPLRRSRLRVTALQPPPPPT